MDTSVDEKIVTRPLPRGRSVPTWIEPWELDWGDVLPSESIYSSSGSTITLSVMDETGGDNYLLPINKTNEENVVFGIVKVVRPKSGRWQLLRSLNNVPIDDIICIYSICNVILDKERWIKDNFVLINDTKIFEFLQSHDYLKDILIDSHQELERYFPNTDKILELITDPESEAKRERLFIYNTTELPVITAIRELKKFDRDWWFTRLCDAKGNLCITLEYL